MLTLNQKLGALKTRLLAGGEIRVMIIGLGSVGNYLLDYLVSLADPQLHIVVVGRNAEKMQQDVNIVRTAATIRQQLRSKITVVGGCDLNSVDSITKVLEQYQPDFIVNSSRAYAGLKYGTISWVNLRAYGIWAPLSAKFAKNIMLAYEKADCHAISINTSYSDAVLPWIKSAGHTTFDFGSGNLNHLIPRMKFYMGEKYGIENYNDIDVTLAVSHFHDVVISKEGHAEGQKLLLKFKHNGSELPFEQNELLKACAISMPTDQKRNMMNASSNFNIICSILKALREESCEKVHTPGFDGFIGGYPVLIDGKETTCRIYDHDFTLGDMINANRESIYHDGIEDVQNGKLVYTDELIAKVKTAFGCDLPKTVNYDNLEQTAQWLINNIITPQFRTD